MLLGEKNDEAFYFVFPLFKISFNSVLISSDCR